MKINKETVEYIANLSRLVLSEKEKESFKNQLDKILSYIDKLSEIDTSKVKGEFSAIELKNISRKDKRKPSLTQKEALSNAGRSDKGYFKVPKIIE